eukprot:scaffold1830_cov117-Cylindrotheca_fusiformis.AAC.9
MKSTESALLMSAVRILAVIAFQSATVRGLCPSVPASLRNDNSHRKIQVLRNIYDDWRSDAVVDTMFLDEENVQMCLDEFIDSDYGKQMFGCHERPATVGITGSIEFVEICGPEVTLSLSGKFWHRRETVLGRAAMWLNARMPEITDVMVADPEELKDVEDILDDFGEVVFQKDKRSPDFNGDREAMEYQGRDPDMRGPFPQGMTGAGSMINPDAEEVVDMYYLAVVEGVKRLVMFCFDLLLVVTPAAERELRCQ